MECRLCGSTNLKLYYTQGIDNQYKFYKCSNCKLVNYDISVNTDQIKYESVRYVDPYDMSKKQNKDQSQTYKFIKKTVKTKGKLLDIGCGNGKLLLLAKDDGMQVKGIELSKLLADTITKKYNIQVEAADFTEYNSKSNDVYDVVVLRHVLEHLPDSIIVMNKINTLLNKGGFAVLEFPNIEGYEMKIKRYLIKTGLHRKKYSKKYKPGHCNEFCKESFIFLLNKTGYRLVKWSTYSSKTFLNVFYKYTNFGSKTRVLIEKI